MSEDGSCRKIGKLSLRRALWQARMAARTVCEQALLACPEREATRLLRNTVKQQLRDQPLDGFISGVCRIESDWQREVLRRDPQVIQVDNPAELACALACTCGDRDVLASYDLLQPVRESGFLNADRLRLKTVFIDD
jgi:hypothetical protein